MMRGIVCVHAQVDRRILLQKKKKKNRLVYDLETTTCEVKRTFDCASEVAAMIQEKHSSTHDLS